MSYCVLSISNLEAIMKKLFTIVLFSLVLTACDKVPQETNVASTVETQQLDKVEQRAEKATQAYESSFMENFSISFRQNFILNCVKVAPANATEPAQKLCECAADKALVEISKEGVERLSQLDDALKAKVKEVSMQAAAQCMAEMK